MDKTRIIAVANHKGGVGKTTTVATLGSIFAKVGVRVLMVDLDAQCNLTDTFLSEVEGPTVYEGPQGLHADTDQGWTGHPSGKPRHVGS